MSEIRRRMNRVNSKPYAKCIEQLNKMDSRKGSVLTPMDKMNCIADISSCIKEEV